MERIKFYADTDREKNKYFVWKITSILNIKDALWRFFDKGWAIRSCWYEKINEETGEVENQRINIQEQFDLYIKEKFTVNGKWIKWKHSK